MWPWFLIIVITLGLALLAAQRWRSSEPSAADDNPADREPTPGKAALVDAADATGDGEEAPAAADEAEAAASPPAVRPPRPLAPFNHRRHWAILEGVEDAHGFLLQILKQLLREDSNAGAFVRDDLCHLVDNRGHLMFSALMRRGERMELLAMFPYSESPHIWPLQVRRIEESPDGIEARLLGSCGEATVGIYDTLYLKNRDAYHLGDTYELQVSAVAYQLEPDELGEDFAPDFSGFGPLSSFSPDPNAAPDEVVFHSYIESVAETTFWRVPLRVYVIPLGRPEAGAEPLRVEVYVQDEVAERAFEVGERVRGVLWLYAMWPAHQTGGSGVPAGVAQLN